MSNVFVTQSGAGARDGASIATAFSLSDHNNTTFLAGDVIYIAGAITSSIVPPSSGASGNPITYRFDWPGAPGTLTFVGSGSSININNKSYLTIKEPELTGAGTTAGILLQGTTAGIIIDSPVMEIGNTRGIYLLGNAHTNWQILNPTITTGAGDITTANDYAAIQIWGNSATAGVGGTITNPVLRSAATGFASTASGYVGLLIDDWDSLVATGVDIDGYHTGLRITNADNNDITLVGIANCDNGGLKSISTGGGQGVLIELTSTGNIVRGGMFESNYQNYVDASSVGGNVFCNARHANHTVNAISIVSTGAALTDIYNQVIDHAPIDSVGHGFVVQNGSANTNVRARNLNITCLVAGANIQCVAIAGDRDQVDIDYSRYHVGAGANIGALDSTNYDTLAAWQAALTGDVTIVGADASALVDYLPRTRPVAAPRPASAVRPAARTRVAAASRVAS